MERDDDASLFRGGDDASAGDGGAPPSLDGETAGPPAGSNEHADTESGDVVSTAEQTPAADDGGVDPGDAGPRVAVGEYTWADFLGEYGDDGDVTALYRGHDPRERRGDDADPDRWDDSDAVEIPTPTRADWAEVGLDPESYLDSHPVDIDQTVTAAATVAVRRHTAFEAFCDPSTTPVVKGEWLWEHYKREYYYNEDGSRPRDADGNIERFDPADALGFDPDAIEDALAHGARRAEELDEVVDERTVDVDPAFDEDAFFADARGTTTVVNRYDLEKAVPIPKKTHFREVERYWVDKPHAFVIIFHSEKENEKKYYVVQPYRTPIETDLVEFLTGKLRTAIKYDDESVIDDTPGTRRRTIEHQTLELLERYGLYQVPDNPRAAGLSVLPSGTADDAEGGILSGLDIDINLGSDTDEPSTPDRSERRMASIARSLGLQPGSLGGRFDGLFGGETEQAVDYSLDGIAARPEPAVVAEDSADLSDYQVEKLLYALRRDFIGYERIDGIKHDVNVEDISCDGYNSRVFVYHSDYEQLITNVSHGEDELDDFVVKLAQRSGKGISKRRPQVDATLPDGSRAQLTLGREVSDHGTNYTIRQFKDVPFTPVDLINWKTFSLEEMAFLWLCIENDKSLIFAGGTASGKTTSLNAVSLFIPSNAKIVSIEDTREVELPQRNWVASVTRPSFTDDDGGDVDEFDLLEAALRQRPDYIVMGEIRGEEGRTLFQVMSTGHTTYTTFHADSVGEVLKRFTTDPINVSKTMFTALDLVSIQTSTRVQGDKVRRNKSLTEINHYDAENDEINVQDVYQWQAEGDEFLRMGSSNTVEDIKFDRGWTSAELDTELFKRRVVLAYLIDRGLNTYTQVAATLQAFINDEETILALMARDELERSLEDLREMESVKIDVDPEKEEMVPRPTPGADVREFCAEILAAAEDDLWPDYRDLDDVDVADALLDVDAAPDVAATGTGGDYPELDRLDEQTEAPALDEGPETTVDAADAGPSGATPESVADRAARSGTEDDSLPTDGDSGSTPRDIDTDDPDEAVPDAVDLLDQFGEQSAAAESGADTDQPAEATDTVAGERTESLDDGPDAGAGPTDEATDAELTDDGDTSVEDDGSAAGGGSSPTDGPVDTEADPFGFGADDASAATDTATDADGDSDDSTGIEDLLTETDTADDDTETGTADDAGAGTADDDAGAGTADDDTETVWSASGFERVDPSKSSTADDADDRDRGTDEAASDGGTTADRGTNRADAAREGGDPQTDEDDPRGDGDNTAGADQ